MDEMDFDFDEEIIIKVEPVVFSDDVVSPSHIDIPDLVTIVQNDNGEAAVLQTSSNKQDSVLIPKFEQGSFTEQFPIDIPPLVTIVRNPNGKTVVQKFIDPADQNNLSNRQKAPQQKACSCSCFLCTLFWSGLSSFTSTETDARIKMGRPTPKLDQHINMKNRSRNFIRKLEPSLYKTYSWLTACATTKKLYCWSCLLFESTDKTSLLHRGMIELQSIHTCLKWHGNLESHLSAHLKEKVIASKLAKGDVNVSVSAKQHNELVAKNRKVLERLIDVMCFRAGYQVTPRGPRSDQGNESVIIDLIKLCDPTLIHQIESIPRFDLPSIYNSLEICLCDLTIKEIKSEISNAKFVSFIFYDVLNKKDQSHIAAMVRYIKYISGKPVAQNRFLSHVNVPSCDRTADLMTKITSDLIISLDCKEKIISQSYCGASILPKQLGIVQLRITEAYPTALNVYCSGFKMCETIAQSLSMEIDVCKEFFAELEGISELFSKYPTLEESLKVSMTINTTPLLAWNINGDLFKKFAEIIPHTLKMFRQVIQESERWNHELVNACRGYVAFLETEKTFNFLLSIFADIFSQVDDVAELMRSKPYDITNTLQKINYVVRELENIRIQYALYISSKSLLRDDYEPVKKKGPQPDFKHLCSKIIDNILTQLRTQLRNYRDLEFLKYFNFKEGKILIMGNDLTHYMAKSYQAIFDKEALDSQFRTILRSTDVDLNKTPAEMLTFLKDTELDAAFSEVAKLIELVLTIPCSDGSNSQLAVSLEKMAKYIKSSDDKKMAFLATERSLIQQLSQNPKFHEEVLNLFVTANDKVNLNFK